MKNSWIENPNGENMLLCLLYMYKFLFLKNTDFWWYFKVSSLGKFWQILAVLGRFGQIFLHSQWLRACPNLG
jgi:hypothetical protein